MKICCICKENKNSQEFNRHKNRKDGLQTICRDCRTKYHKDYSIKNKNKLSEYNKQHYQIIKTEKEIKRRIYRETNPQRILFYTAKRRAIKKGMEFNLEISDIIIPLICPILKIPLKMNFNKRNNNSVSLDRIDNNKGYIKNNIQIISWRANWIKNNASLEELKALVNFMEWK